MAGGRTVAMTANQRSSTIAAILVAAICCADGKLLAAEPQAETAADFAGCRDAAPADAAELYKSGAEHFRARRWAEAVADYRRLLAADPEHPFAGSARFYLAESLVHAGEHAAAADAWLAFLATKHDAGLTPAARFRAGECCYLAGRRDDARRELDPISQRLSRCADAAARAALPRQHRRGRRRLSRRRRLLRSLDRRVPRRRSLSASRARPRSGLAARRRISGGVERDPLALRTCRAVRGVCRRRLDRLRSARTFGTRRRRARRRSTLPRPLSDGRSAPLRSAAAIRPPARATLQARRSRRDLPKARRSLPGSRPTRRTALRAGLDPAAARTRSRRHRPVRRARQAMSAECTYEPTPSIAWPSTTSPKIARRRPPSGCATPRPRRRRLAPARAASASPHGADHATSRRCGSCSAAN